MEFNLNDSATVILNQKGADIINAQNIKLQRLCSYDLGFKLHYAGEKYSTELWNIMSIFGSSLECGSSAPFKNNSIIITKQV